MSHVYIDRGSVYTVANKQDLEIPRVDKLPPGNYVLNNSLQGFYFKKTDRFILPKKYYGDLESKAERIITTWVNRLENNERGTGVLLNGLKGSGKTLLAKEVASRLDVPVIMVNQPYHGNNFSELIQELGPCVILFDEFEKVYAEQEKQQALLTMFDGTYDIKALSFFIINNKHNLASYFLNRPGRIFYSFEYSSLEDQFIKDYCKDKLENKENIPSVLAISQIANQMNFDVLQALVEEMNRYGENAFQSSKYINLKTFSVDQSSLFEYVVTKVTYKGKVLDPSTYVPSKLDNNIIQRLSQNKQFWLNITPRKTDENVNEETGEVDSCNESNNHLYFEEVFGNKNIKKVDLYRGLIILQYDDYEFTIQRRYIDNKDTFENKLSSSYTASSH